MTRHEYCWRWCDPAYAARVHAEALRIYSDGCSSLTQAYRIVCEEHDIHYATHRDFFTGRSITEEDADLMLRWGIQWHSWLGRGSLLAWVRYTGLSKQHGLGLGSAAWDTGPARLRERLQAHRVRSEIIHPFTVNSSPPNSDPPGGSHGAAA